MKTKILVIMAIALLVLSASFAPALAVQPDEKKNNGNILERIHEIPGVDKDSILVGAEKSFKKNNIIHISFSIKDENGPLPIPVDVWVKKNKVEKKITYISPGAGLSVKANFNTNPDKTFIEDLIEDKNMVVGINPRQVGYDPESSDYSEEVLANYDLPSHTKDMRKVIELFQNAGFDCDYKIEGHSAGALIAAVCAAEIGNSDPHFKGLDIHDMALQFKQGTPQAYCAAISYDALNDLLESGVYEYSSMEEYKTLADIIRAYPGVHIDSGVPRVFAPGNFSVEGLFYFASIHTGYIPGPITDTTGLPDSWYFGNGGYLSGNYQFALDPADDVYSFHLTDIETMFEALDKVEYGAHPTILERDIMSVWNGTYPVNWDNIAVPVNWENAQLGFGDISEIDKAHEILSEKSGFKYSVKKGYSHADIMYAGDTYS